MNEISELTVHHLRLKLRFSKRFALVLIILHCGALLLLLPLTLPVEFAIVKLGLGFLVLLSALQTIRQHLLLINPFKVQLQKTSASNDVQKKVLIASGSYFHPQLVVLRLENVEKGEINTVIFFPDALDVETFRRLRLLHLNKIRIS
jgi:hypothetical protein